MVLPFIPPINSIQPISQCGHSIPIGVRYPHMTVYTPNFITYFLNCRKYESCQTIGEPVSVMDQYPSHSSCFLYIHHTEKCILRTKLEQSTFSMSYCKLSEGLVAFVRTERRQNRYLINMHNEGLHLQQNR